MVRSGSVSWRLQYYSEWVVCRFFPWSGGEYYFRPDIHFWIAYGDFRCSIGDDYQPGKGVTKDIFRLGTWNFIMQGTNCLVQIVCNATLQNYGGDVYVGIMTVANSVREIFMLPVSGIENIFLWFCIHGISICRTIHVSGIGRCEACDFLLLAS